MGGMSVVLLNHYAFLLDLIAAEGFHFDGGVGRTPVLTPCDSLVITEKNAAEGGASRLTLEAGCALEAVGLTMREG